MIKTILVVIVSLFAALFFIGVGAGITVSLECSNESATSSQYTSCMEAKAAKYGKY